MQTLDRRHAVGGADAAVRDRARHARARTNGPRAASSDRRCRAARAHRQRVAIVVEPIENFKVTHRGRLLARKRSCTSARGPCAVRVDMMMRVGHGFDAHRLVEGRPFVLGGVTIPFERGPLGHSDGDTLTHAISRCVARRGRARRSRRAFPRYRSAMEGRRLAATLLAAVHEQVVRHGWTIANIDSTVVVQAPKLAPHIAAMRDDAGRNADARHREDQREGEDERRDGLHRRRERHRRVRRRVADVARMTRRRTCGRDAARGIAGRPGAAGGGALDRDVHRSVRRALARSTKPAKRSRCCAPRRPSSRRSNSNGCATGRSSSFSMRRAVRRRAARTARTCRSRATSRRSPMSSGSRTADAFAAVRMALTGREEGPPLELLFPLLGHDRIMIRVGAVSSRLLHGRGLEPIAYGPGGDAVRDDPRIQPRETTGRLSGFVRGDPMRSAFATFLADLRAPVERDPAAEGWLDVSLSYPGFHAITAHRAIHALWQRRVPLLPRLLSEMVHRFTGIDIHPGRDDRPRRSSSTTAPAS